MRVVLFGLTGYGTEALRALLASGIPVSAVITRRESADFPYYHCEQIVDVAERASIPVMYESGADEPAVDHALKDAEALVVCSYHRKISPSRIAAVRLAMNAHPSLLPCYRGATPEPWPIYYGDGYSGVTLHYLGAGFDTGDIITQQRLELTSGETNGSLRARLASLSGRLVVETLQAFERDGALPRRPQTGLPSAAPRPDERARSIDEQMTTSDITRIVRAFSPFPGALFASGPQRWKISGVPADGVAGRILHVAARDGNVALCATPL